MRVVKNTPDEGSPSLRMRGNAFHNHLAAQVARDFLRAGFGVRAEYGLRGPTINVSTQAASGGILARKRPDLLAVEQKRRLLISRSVIRLSERATVVVGRRPSGKPRAIPV